MQLGGIHHLTAVTARAARNHAFYTRDLGLRLVKKTVNQDDVSAYHLFYGDGAASPGSDLTFFDWPVAPETRGTGSIARTALRVPAASLEWWENRLRAAGVAVRPAELRAGRRTVDFEDSEGQRLSLTADGPGGHPWERSPVPPEHQILGLGPVTLSVPRAEPTARILTEVLGMRLLGREEGRSIYAMGPGGAAAEIHLVVAPGPPRARLGAGGAHHVAFRVATAEEYAAWTERLQEMRVPNSGPVDRHYFRSLYLREPNGILFELATDGPGFAVDEPAEHLGERLALPPFLEPRRREIESALKPLTSS